MIALRRRSTAVALFLPLCLSVLPAVAADDNPAVAQARRSARIAGYSLSKVQRWLHEVALKKIEPDTGLYHPDGRFNYQDAWADCYPFLCWAAWATDLEAFNGPVRRALLAEEKHCPPGFFAKPENTFGGSEYVKDGLVAIVEITGHDQWFDRMKAIEDEIWSNCTVQTPYGPIPSNNLEINGEQLQVLARLFTMTGEKKYLQWAERLADSYLLPGNFLPPRLRDHGCEIIGGLGLLLGVESEHNPDKARQYLPLIRNLLDAVLEKGTNEDGLMFNWLGKPDSGLSDGWGYNYVAYLCYDLASRTPHYRPRVQHVLQNIAKPRYRNYPWEGRSIDGFADSLEGAIYLLNRLPLPTAAQWVDAEVAANVAYADQPLDSAPLWGTMKLQSNGVRTVIMHAFMHTRGLLARPWQQGMELGAAQTGPTLTVAFKSPRPWTGRLVFDKPRHRLYMRFRTDWPRMNCLPQWFTVQADQDYLIQGLPDHPQPLRLPGSLLQLGLPLTLQPGQQCLLTVSPAQPDPDP